jgi:hypothetical protein
MRINNNESFVSCSRPDCLICSSNNIKVVLALKMRGIPHDKKDHKFVYDYNSIFICNDCDRAQLESYSHDCYSYDEDWDMWWWYVLDKLSSNYLRSLLVNCPNPLDYSCNCSLHLSLRESAERLWGGIKHSTTSYSNLFSEISLETKEGKLAFILC